jgi:Na+-transporting methylmalonyl-CoA/oxaloacetate decarboxylase gamma subunit
MCSRKFEMGVKMTSMVLLVVAVWGMSLLCRSTVKISLKGRNELNLGICTLHDGIM